MALKNVTKVQVAQHGDAVSTAYMAGLDAGVRGALQGMLWSRVDHREAVVVCHSEPGAWSPPMYHPGTYCPPAGSWRTAGRTMFETGAFRVCGCDRFTTRHCIAVRQTVSPAGGPGG